MALSTGAKNRLNRVLSAVNLRLDSLTRERIELQHLEKLAAHGHFERPVFPVPDAFRKMDADTVFRELPQHAARFSTFRDSAKNDAGFSLDNAYFSSPDAEVLYAMVRRRAPARIIEVGSGNSTRIMRQAIRDGKLKSHITSIDPQPRIDINEFVDEKITAPAEQVDEKVFAELLAGDLLFIDSSHELKPGNDCVHLFLRVLPQLRPGVIVHVHDIFLPYDYPLAYIQSACWAEQYLVQALLCGGGWEVLWASHYLFRGQPDMARAFPHGRSEHACSLWMRRE